MACKPDFVPEVTPLDDHSSGPAVANRLLQPTRICWSKSGPGCCHPRDPYLVLLPAGLAMPVMLPPPRWALTPPFHRYLRERRQSDLCGAFPRVSPGGRYPPLSLFGVRTFLTYVRSSSHPRTPNLSTIHTQGQQPDMAIFLPNLPSTPHQPHPIVP
jgi:hypothetical protein